MPKRQPRLDYYTDTNGQHRWRVFAGNGKIISQSSEGYARKTDCEKSVDITFCAFRLADGGNGK